MQQSGAMPWPGGRRTGVEQRCIVTLLSSIWVAGSGQRSADNHYWGSQVVGESQADASPKRAKSHTQTLVEMTATWSLRPVISCRPRAQPFVGGQDN